MNKEDLLSKSKHFCILPWIHLHAWPNGGVFPCCVADSSQPVANLKNQSFKEAWNSPAMRELRLKMLKDQPSSQCRRCYALEEAPNAHTLRKVSNRTWAQHWAQVESTQADGTVENLRLSFFDIRFSNVCNFKCHSCGPTLSNAWFEDHQKIFGPSGNKRTLRLTEVRDIWPELEPYLLDVEMVNFAGGEPLLCDDHLRLMEHWRKHNHKNVAIEYTTNFSTLVFKGQDMLEHWKHFDEVVIRASLDAAGPRAEYMRKGTKWNEIVANRQRLIAEAPQIKFFIAPTISVFNVWHFPDFHRQWIEAGLIRPDQVRLSVLTESRYMSLDILPYEIKQELISKYEKALKRLVHEWADRDIRLSRVRQAYQAVITFLKRPSDTSLIPEFFERTAAVDRARAENLLSIFPELESLYEYFRRAQTAPTAEL